MTINKRGPQRKDIPSNKLRYSAPQTHHCIIVFARVGKSEEEAENSHTLEEPPIWIGAARPQSGGSNLGSYNKFLCLASTQLMFIKPETISRFLNKSIKWYQYISNMTVPQPEVSTEALL